MADSLPVNRNMMIFMRDKAWLRFRVTIFFLSFSLHLLCQSSKFYARIGLPLRE